MCLRVPVLFHTSKCVEAGGISVLTCSLLFYMCEY